MMRNLPVPVTEEDIDAMFDFADKDRDGKINYRFTFYIINVCMVSHTKFIFQWVWDNDKSKNLQTASKIFISKSEKVHATNQGNG